MEMVTHMAALTKKLKALQEEMTARYSSIVCQLNAMTRTERSSGQGGPKPSYAETVHNTITLQVERPKREVTDFYLADAEQPTTSEEIKQKVVAALQSKQHSLRITNDRRISANGVNLKSIPEDTTRIKELNL